LIPFLHGFHISTWKEKDIMKAKPGTHIREYGGFLAAPEKKALQWLAQRTPSWINSDHLTLLGLASMLLAGTCYWISGQSRWALIAAVLALALNWLGDSLDGTLARFRNHQRPRYGFYVDHVIDLFGTAALLGGLALSGYMNPLISIGMLAAFALVEAEVFLATHVQRVFRLSCFRIGPTELRIVLAIGTLYLFHNPWIRIGKGSFLLFDVGGLVAIVGLLAAFTYSAIRNTRALYQAEPLDAARKSDKANPGIYACDCRETP
jgi:archaetidylinositol phosphate synthase